jgi:hypothetical protein
VAQRAVVDDLPLHVLVNLQRRQQHNTRSF